MTIRNLQFKETSIEPRQGVLLEAELSSSLSDFVNQSIEMATRSPDILAEIDHDLDVHGLKKKALRDAD
ncbi:MAG: hypothetical protein ACI957_003363, partial [Verrucomicrobiales bacterium]